MEVEQVLSWRRHNPTAFLMSFFCVRVDLENEGGSQQLEKVDSDQRECNQIKVAGKNYKRKR